MATCSLQWLDDLLMGLVVEDRDILVGLSNVPSSMGLVGSHWFFTIVCGEDF